jgi:pimeloyl-ACP methyl ester carboxylesterase
MPVSALGLPCQFGFCFLSLCPVEQEWLEQIGIRLVSYDRPGYGQSDAYPPRNTTTEARDVASAAAQLQLPDEFHILAVGAGSYVAWTMLHEFPEK